MILFLTRKYPPSIGGMQKQSFELTSAIKVLRESYVISWGNSQALLPWFLLTSFAKACWILSTRKIEVIHLGDALLSPSGIILGKAFRKPVVATVHGKDVVFDFKPYQFLIRRSLKLLDKIICVSASTQQRVVERGVPKRKTTVIPNGIDTAIQSFKHGRDNDTLPRTALENAIGRKLHDKTLLLSVGRLVERKGVKHFVREVLPEIVSAKPDVVFLVAGDGPEQSAIEQSIRERELEKHVILLGCVEQDMLSVLFRAADIFVMPNIPVQGDMEGFGIVVLEACASGLPVVAFDLEGIKDTIVHGENGFLVDAGNSDALISTLISLIDDPSSRKEMGRKARDYVVLHFGWDGIANRYLEEFDSVAKAMY